MKAISVQSPGRINIIGEHTDYNDGFVLPAAIDKRTVFHLQKNGTASQINLLAENLNEAFSFDLQSFQPLAGGWQNYVMGVVAALQKAGAPIRGFDGQFKGDVPIGAGMSSSAALECSLAYGLNELFGLGFDRWQLIKAAQWAEHHFAGIKCGIMDQFASMMGKERQVMLLDCRSLTFEYFPLDLHPYELLLLNTQVSHSLADSEYNKRREDCEEGVAVLQKVYPEIQSLRDVSPAQLDAQTEVLPERIYRRCRHVISENQRVLDATRALQNADYPQLGRLLYQSHHSLQKDYEVSCPELDFLVRQAQKTKEVLGSRMMGGGFGGCTLNIIEQQHSERFIDSVARSYFDQFGIQLAPYRVEIKSGTGILEGG